MHSCNIYIYIYYTHVLHMNIFIDILYDDVFVVA